jgi:hypothetical protein
MQVWELERGERRGFNWVLLTWRSGSLLAHRRPPLPKHRLLAFGHTAACQEARKQLLAPPHRLTRPDLDRALQVFFFFSLTVDIAHRRRSNSSPPKHHPSIPLSHSLSSAVRKVGNGSDLDRVESPCIQNQNTNPNRKPIPVKIYHQNQTRGYPKLERIPETRMDTRNPRINIHIFTCINKRQ